MHLEEVMLTGPPPSYPLPHPHLSLLAYSPNPILTASGCECGSTAHVNIILGQARRFPLHLTMF